MREMFFMELRDKWKEIRDMEKGMSPEEKEAARSCIYDTVEQLYKFAFIAETAGVLSIECELNAEEMQDAMFRFNMLTNMVDGYDAECLEELYMMQYFAEQMNPYTAVSYLYFLYGVVAITERWSAYIIWSYFCELLPEDMKETCRNMSLVKAVKGRNSWKEKYCVLEESDETELLSQTQEQENEDEQNFEFVQELAPVDEIPDDDPRMELVHKMCNAESPARYGEPGFRQMRAVDLLLEAIGSEGILHLITKLDHEEWAEAMGGMSGGKRKLIFSHMSNQTAYEIAQTFNVIWTDNACEAVPVLKSIISYIKELVDNGAVVLQDKRIKNLFDYMHD